MDDCEAEMIEATLERLRRGDLLLQLCAAMASSAVRTTRQQLHRYSECCARRRTLDAEAAKRAADALETTT